MLGDGRRLPNYVVSYEWIRVVANDGVCMDVGLLSKKQFSLEIETVVLTDGQDVSRSIKFTARLS